MVQRINLSFSRPRLLTLGMSGSGGSNSYLPLTDKPSINGVELIGNKTDAEIYVQALMDEITPQQIDTILYGG